MSPARHASPASHDRSGQRGQSLALVALAMVAVLAMVGLILDGGNAWARQRLTQNAADAAAEAGAVVLVRTMAGEAHDDADVLAAVQASLAGSGTELVSAGYTDVAGAGLGVAVGQAPGGAIPAGAAGVAVTGRQAFDTFVAGIVGIRQLTATTDATAVAGLLEGLCAGDAGCGVWPLAIPLMTVACDGRGDPVPGTEPWPTDGTIVEIPLCTTAAGNVGWLDWRPPAGGASEIADSITNPDNPAIDVPDWYFVAETGNVNSAQVQSALRRYRDRLVTVPLFSATCREDPGTAPGGAPAACATDPGGGQSLWYFLSGYSGFRLCGPTTPGCMGGRFGDVSQGAYITGSPRECSAGHGTGCLFGRFETVVTSGRIGGGTGGGDSRALGVQLVR